MRRGQDGGLGSGPRRVRYCRRRARGRVVMIPGSPPKPQYKGAWQSAEALLQFSIDLYGAHRPKSLDHNVHVTNFRPAVFNEPVAAAIQHLHTDDGTAASYTARATNLASELIATTSVRPDGRPSYRNQLGCHGAQMEGGNPPTRQQTAPDRFAVGHRRKALHDELKAARSVFFVRACVLGFLLVFGLVSFFVRAMRLASWVSVDFRWGMVPRSTTPLLGVTSLSGMAPRLCPLTLLTPQPLRSS